MRHGVPLSLYDKFEVVGVGVFVLLHFDGSKHIQVVFVAAADERGIVHMHGPLHAVLPAQQGAVKILVLSVLGKKYNISAVSFHTTMWRHSSLVKS